MTSQKSADRMIFLEAIEHVPQDRWDAFLRDRCAGDPQQIDRVQRLLDAHRQLGDVRERSPAVTFETSTAVPADAQIGPYKLREQIGQGGMGVVYVAEQTEPVKRKVALKVIKPGMETRQVIARFEAERQALAMMDHPNIARIIDAGSTESGQSFFVMELVYGIPITEYCDQHELPNRERLAIIVKVCQAVQHAHQKGVIHRDLKPSNVLVASIDGQAVPKVIDFGVAKAAGPKLIEETVYTQFSQMIGTPLYMSPEQAELGVADVDTRSDIYALGVLLYELLTGNTPFSSETLKRASFDEMRRIIREDDPPKPSAMLCTLKADALSTISKHRGIDSRRLRDLLTGELDWLVMKALEKDRNRRYESPGALAADIHRYLLGEPIDACPPSAVYRFKKLALRNKAAITTAAVVLVALLLGIAGTSWQAWRADREAEKSKAAQEQEMNLRKTAEQKIAETEAVVNFLVDDLLGATRAEEPVDQDLVVDNVLAAAEHKLDAAFNGQPAVEAAIRYALGRTYMGRLDFDRAARHMERAVELRTALLGEEDRETLETAQQLARILYGQGKFDEAQQILLKILDTRRRVLGPEDRHTIGTLDSLADLSSAWRKFDEAQHFHEKTLEIRRRVLGPSHEETLNSMGDLADVFRHQEKFVESEKLYEDTLSICRQANQQPTAELLMGFAQLLREQDSTERAQKIEREAIAYLDKQIKTVRDETNLFSAYWNRAKFYDRQDEFEKAIADYGKAIQLRPDCSYLAPDAIV